MFHQEVLPSELTEADQRLLDLGVRHGRRIVEEKDLHTLREVTQEDVVADVFRHRTIDVRGGLVMNQVETHVLPLRPLLQTAASR